MAQLYTIAEVEPRTASKDTSFKLDTALDFDHHQIIDIEHDLLPPIHDWFKKLSRKSRYCQDTKCLRTTTALYNNTTANLKISPL